MAYAKGDLIETPVGPCIYHSYYGDGLYHAIQFGDARTEEWYAGNYEDIKPIKTLTTWEAYRLALMLAQAPNDRGLPSI